MGNSIQLRKNPVEHIIRQGEGVSSCEKDIPYLLGSSDIVKSRFDLFIIDIILVLDEGKIVQQGTHLDLIEQEGLYKRVWSIQNSLEEELSLEEKGLTESLENDEKLKIS